VTVPAQPPGEGFNLKTAATKHVPCSATGKNGFNEKERASEMDVAEVHGSILRERAEPRAGREPVPLWLLAGFFSIIFWAGLYLAYNSGGFRADVFDPARGARAGGGVASQTGPVDPTVLGRRVFTQNCQVCHQATGLGVARQFPPLAGSEWVIGQDWHGDNHLVKIVLHGLQGAIQVKGNTFNNAMPTWRMLTDDQVADVLTYIRSDWGNAAPPIPAEYVRAIRQQTTSRTEPWSPKDLQAIPAEKAPAATVSPTPNLATAPGG